MLYSAVKDYPAEAERLATHVRALVPGGTRVLDVGCGPGGHAAALARLGFEVDGVDAEPRFVELARARHPAGRFQVADMAELSVERPYDVALSLFGTIGYAVTVARLGAVARALAAAVRPGGGVVVEPWLEPTDVTDGHLHTLTAQEPGLQVCRLSRTRVVGRVSVLELEYLIGRPSGIERCSETHALGLFTRTEMGSALEQAGLEVAFDADGLTGRGLYLCRRKR